MTNSVKVLLVEDNPGDVRLIRVVLAENSESAHFDVTTADRLSRAVEMITADNPDAILLDLSLPDSQGLGTVVSIVTQVPGVPIIVLTGLDDEALAVKALQEGAQDYLVKNQLDGNLLGRTIRYAIERKQVEEALHASQERFRALVEKGTDEIVVLDADLKPIYISPSVFRAMGYSVQESSDLDPFGYIYPDDISAIQKGYEQLLNNPGQSLSFEMRLQRKDGSWRWVEGVGTNLLSDPSVGGIVFNYSDVTQRKYRERELEAVAALSAALRATHTLEETFPPLLDESLKALGGKAGSVWLYDSATDQANMVHQSGWEQAMPPPLKPGEGIVGHVIASGQVYISRELIADPLLHESARAHLRPGQGGIYVPIQAVDQMIGVLTLNIDLPNEFSEADTHLLKTLAEIAGNTIQRTELYEQTRRHLENIAALRTIDKAISTSFDLQFVLNVVLEQLTTQLGVTAADVLLLDPFLHVLEYGAGRGFRTPPVHTSHLQLDQEAQAGRAVLEQRLVGFPSLSKSESLFLYDRGLEAEEFAAYYVVPLISKRQVKGVLEIFHRKPLAPDAEWLNFLETLAGQAAIAIDNATLFNDLQHSNIELTLAYDATIEGWSHALDLRDKETEGHTKRVTEMTIELARVMGITTSELIHIRRGALLHDIGKMGIPDSILLKPDALTEEEWVIMRKHPTYAYEMLSPVQFLRPALDIPYCHHEKWDGTGYPRGMREQEIPLTARIFAVADVYDALTSDRPYRKAWSKQQTLAHIQAGSGAHFDPAAAAAFLRMMKWDG